MITSIVQYEVHFLDQGRWTLHARYPGAERDEAISDARRTEVSTGMPTKVVRDTYFPEENRHEEVVAYISPNAKSEKKKRQRSMSATGASASAGTASSKKHNKASSAGPAVQFNGPLFFTRLLLTLAVGMLIAMGLTALLSLLLSALPKLGVNVPSATGEKVTLYWFLAMFILSTFALNRAYVPWRSVFAKTPQSKKEKIVSDLALQPKQKMQFKPKRSDAKREAEAERELQELRVVRGDISAPEAQDDMSFDAAPHSNETSNSDQPPEAVSTETQQPEEASDGADLKSKKSTGDDTEVSITPKEETEPVIEETDREPPPPLEELDIERLLMVRFLGDTLITIRGSQDQLDSSTRFGLGLYLAGAAAAVADQHGLKPDEERDILSEALHLIGLSKTMIESFLEKYEDNINLKKNQALVEAGQSAMAIQIQSGDTATNGFPTVVDDWKKQNAVKPVPLGDVFLLTHILSPHADPTRIDAEMMAVHNQNVRQAVDGNGGQEVRHTGKGIFASFEHPEDAICAAMTIQRESQASQDKNKSALPLCIALVGTEPGNSDPALSGAAFSLADTLCRRLSTGQIACDALIQAASTIEDTRFGPKIPNAHSGIAEKVNAVEILWDPLPA